MQLVGKRRWRRRQILQGAGMVGLWLLAGCGRWPEQAQQSRQKVPRIGYLTAGISESTVSPELVTLQVDAFRQGLTDLGYLDGQNLVIEYRYTDGSESQLREAAADLVRREVHIIVAPRTPAALAARVATNTIPIVFPAAGDPVGTGLVASLARPGGNVTGLANLSLELSGKRLELLQQVVPGLHRVAYLWDPALPPANLPEMQSAAQVLNLQLQIIEIQDALDYEAAFGTAMAHHADGLTMPAGRFSREHRQIVDLAASSRLPAMYADSRVVREGGLMSYGPNLLEAHRRAATYVDRILKGARPADLPVERPMQFDFAINLRTAQALGLTIPPHVLAQATEVIQ